MIVSSPDLIRHIYRFQYNARPGAVLKAIHAGVGFGSGTETSLMMNSVASFPGSHAPEREIEVVHAWRAWYFLSREKCQR